MKEATQTKRAVLYCRVSTKEQVEEGNSLVTQEKNCREYAQKHGYEVVEIFIEQGESAKTTDRTELKKLMSFCATKKNQINTVIAYKIDRISRNTDDYSQIRILLKKYGVEIKSTSEHFENTPAGRFMENIIANVAQFDNDVRAERSIGGMKQALNEGRYVWMAPLGYSNVKVDGKSTIAPNEKAEYIKLAFELIASKTLSVNETREYIATFGICKKNSKPIGKSHFYTLLKNKLYVGKVIKFGKSYNASFPSIVSENLFDAVQSVISKRKMYKKYTKDNEDFPLRQFIKSMNNQKLSGSWSQGRTQKYPYYRFANEKKSIKKLELEDSFIDYLNSFKLNEDVVELFFKQIEAIIESDILSNIRINEQNFSTKEQELKERRRKVVEMGINAILPDNIVKQEIDEISEALALLEIQKDSQSIKIDILKVQKELEVILKQPGSYWQNLPFEIKKKFQWFVFPNGLVIDNNILRTNTLCSIFNLKNTILDSLSSNVHHPDTKIKLPYMVTISKNKKEEIFELLKEVEKEIKILNEHILVPSIKENN